MKRKSSKLKDMASLKGKAVKHDKNRGKEKFVDISPTQNSDSESDGQFVFKKRRTKREPEHSESDENEDQESSSRDSDGSEISVKRQKKRDSEYFDEPKVPMYKTWYRSNLRTCVNEISSLNYEDAHLVELKKTPIWILFKAITRSETSRLLKKCVKFEDNIKEMVSSFDKHVGKFVVGRELISVTGLDVQLIFGLCGGDKEIILRDSEYQVTPWIKRCFRKAILKYGKKLVLRKHLVFDRLQSLLMNSDPTSITDVARLTTLYLVASVLAPNQNSSVSPHIAGYLEDMNTACQYDWCKYVVDMLVSQIKTTKSIRVGGCTMLLPYWLMEHSKLVRPVSEVSLPRFLKWDTSMLNEKMKKVKLVDLKAEYVRGNKLKPTKRECDMFEGLLRYWEEHLEDNVEEQKEGREEGGTQGTNQSADDEYQTIDICTRTDVEFVGETPGCREDPMTSGYGRKGMVTDKQNQIKRTRRDGPSKTCRLGREGVDAKARELSARRLFSPDMPAFGGGEGTAHSSSPMKNDCNDNDTAVEFDVAYGQRGQKDELLLSELEDCKKKVQEQDNEIAVLSAKIEGMEGQLKEREKEALEGMLKKNLEERCQNDELLLSELEDCKKKVQDKDNEIAVLTAKIEGVEAQLKECENEGLEGMFKTKLEESVSGVEERILTKLKEKDGLLSKMENKVKRTVNLVCEHAAIVKGKDDLIKKLEGDCTRLRGRINELTTPTMTQICEDPNNLAHIDAIEKLEIVATENKVLMKQNASLIDTIDIYQAIDGHPEVSELQGSGGSKGSTVGKPASPNSIYKRVRARSVIGDRKAIVVSPQPNTRELIVIHEGRKDKRQTGRTSKIDELRIDERYEAVSLTNSKIKKMLMDYINKDGVRRVIFEGESELAHVTVIDAIKILHDDRISDNVIDAWADIVLTMYEQRSYANSTTVFTSNCWDLINREINLKVREKLIDDRLASINNDDVLLFPINVKPTDGNNRASGDHWTLLVLDLGTMEWYLLNSLRSRRGGSRDSNLMGASLVVSYVEAKLRGVFKRAGRFHRIMSMSAKKPEVVTCLQQTAESVDCGVIVCQHIENIVLRLPTAKGVFSKKKSAEYRSKMVSWFVDPTSVKVDEVQA